MATDKLVPAPASMSATLAKDVREGNASTCTLSVEGMQSRYSRYDAQ